MSQARLGSTTVEVCLRIHNLSQLALGDWPARLNDWRRYTIKAALDSHSKAMIRTRYDACALPTGARRY